MPGLGKIKTVEIIVRGDIIEKNLILKFANRRRESKLRAYSSSTIAVPPVLKAVEGATQAWRSFTAP